MKPNQPDDRDDQLFRFAVPAANRLDVLVWLAKAALLFERLVRALAPAIAVLCFFVALSWTGLWLGAPSFVRIAGSLAFGLLLVFTLWRLRGLTLPSADDARNALDAGRPDAPARALADALANQGAPQTQALWRLHLRRMERRAARLGPVRPSPRLWTMDPYAIGSLAVLALCASAFLAGPEKYARVAAAFDWRLHPGEGSVSRIDAWIDPPAYTGRPPIVLALKDAREPKPDLAAPVNSIIVVRASGSELQITPRDGIEPAAQKIDKTQADRALKESRFVLRGDGTLKLKLDGSTLAEFSLHAIPDLPPTITPLDAPKPNLRGTFGLSYKIEDDYGAHEASVSALPTTDAPAPTGHVLVAPPNGSLELPAAPGGLGEGKSVIDWSDSPYAGAAVDLKLRVVDEAGNEGQAIVKNVRLPQKPMKNPLALALAEQRRMLALDSGQKDTVLSALDALLIAPELFTPKVSIYLGLRHAYAALRRARGDADLVTVSEFLWAMALQIEEGDAPQAERDLRDAQKALREALNRGASQEEIDRLTEQLRKALDNYLAEMAKKSPANPGESETGEGQPVTPQDFKSMLDQLAEAAKNGDKEAARELLDRLQDMLDNLRSTDRSKSAEQAAKDRRALRDLDRMMREQQKLRDDTFAHQRETESQPSPDRDAPQQGEPDPKSLDSRQGQLRQKLDQLNSERRGASKSLKEAEGSMSEAEKSLKKGDDSSALAAQERALGELRKGAGEIAGQGKGNGEGDEESQAAQKGQKPGGKNGESPFSRAVRGDEVRATAAQKARKVLDELRRRLADPNRAPEELDYLERLIRPD